MPCWRHSGLRRVPDSGHNHGYLMRVLSSAHKALTSHPGLRVHEVIGTVESLRFRIS